MNHLSKLTAKMAHTRQSRPDFGLGFQVKSLKPFKVFPLHSAAVVKHDRNESGGEVGRDRVVSLRTDKRGLIIYPWDKDSGKVG